MAVPTPHADALARIPVREREFTILGSRTRFSSVPPYSSVRLLLSGVMKLESRYPWAQCSSTMSNPASIPRRVALTN